MGALRVTAFFDSADEAADALQDVFESARSSHVSAIRGAMAGFFGVALIGVHVETFIGHVRAAGPGALLLIDTKPASWASEKDGPLTMASVSLRLDMSPTWLQCLLLETETDEAPDVAEPDDGEPAWKPLPGDVLIGLAVNAALSPSFGRLKTQAMRLELVTGLLADGEDAETTLPHAREIAARADAYFDAAVLPTRVQALLAAGQPIAKIAEGLGVSKNQAIRASTAVVPDFMAQALAEHAKDHPDL